MESSPRPSPLICSIDVAAGTSIPLSPSSELVPDGKNEIHELVALTRELVQLSREQLRVLRKAEERYHRQQQMQKDEFQRWFVENNLEGQCKEAYEHVRRLLGSILSEFVTFVAEHHENLSESEFTRSEMVDRYGALLNHVSAMHGVLKRLAVLDEPRHESSHDLSF